MFFREMFSKGISNKQGGKILLISVANDLKVVSFYNNNG